MAHSILQSGQFWVVVGGFTLATAFYLYKTLHKKLVLREDELLANGLGIEKEKFVRDGQGFLKKKLTQRRVKGFYDKKTQRFVLTVFNRELNNENISQKNPVIEKITGKKVVEARIEKKWLKYRAVFYLENFKAQVGLADLKGKKLLTGDFFVGLNPRGEPQINSTIEEQNFITTIVGGAGSGKTTAITSQNFTFINSFLENGEKPPRLFIVDIKKTDFLPLIDFFKEKTEVRFFNPLELEDLQALNQEIEKYIAENTAFFKKLADKNISVRHWHYLTGELKQERPHHTSFIFDEIPTYLSANENKVKLSKEPTELEQRAFDEQEERKKLSLLLTRMFNTQRPTGTTIWLASQTGSVSDLAIPFNNLRSHFLMSKTTGATAQVWGLPQDLATRNDLRRGLFIYSNSKETGVVKTPFIEIKEDNKNGK